MFDILIVVACIAAVLAGGWYIAHATPQTKETSYIYEERKINRYASPKLVDRVDESENPHIVAEKSGADAVEVPTSELPKQEVKLKAGPAPATESVADSEPGNMLDSEKDIRCGLYYLSSLLTQYGNTAAALCAYHAGHDTGDRTYSNAVLSAAEEWLQYTQTIS